MTLPKIKNIDSNYPLLYLLTKGRDFTVESNISKEEMAKRIMKKDISLAIAQKDEQYIGIKIDGIKTFEEFFNLTGIKVNSSNIPKVGKILRRAFSENLGGVAAHSRNFNFKYINKEENAVNYDGDSNRLFQCFDGAMFADAKFLSELWGSPVYEHDSFLGTVIINGVYSKGLITARTLAKGTDLVTYDAKTTVAFPDWVNYIHLMYKIKPCHKKMKGDVVCFRNPNGSVNENIKLHLIDSNYIPPSTTKFNLSNLDLQSIINFDLFRFLPEMVTDYLEGILSRLNSNDIRELLGGFQPEATFDDRWLLFDLLQNSSIEISRYPGLLRKTQTFFKSALDKLNIYELKEGDKFQVPNNYFQRSYLAPDPTAVDEHGIYLGCRKGQLTKGTAKLYGGNLYLNVYDPEDTAKLLQTLGGADLDGDSVLITDNQAIVNHISHLNPIGNEKFEVGTLVKSECNVFSKYLPSKENSYDEYSFLKLINDNSLINLGSCINKFMLLFQLSKDQGDKLLLEQLTPCLNGIENLIDACIGQADINIGPIINRLDKLMKNVLEIPDFLQNRFLDSVTGIPKYPSYVSPDTRWFHEVNKIVNDFKQAFNQLQSNPQIDIELFYPVSKAINTYGQKCMYRYQKSITDKLKEGVNISEAYEAGVSEVKRVYNAINENEALELTAALISRVYLRDTPKGVLLGKQSYPDSILFINYLEGETLAGPGACFSKLIKSKLGQQVSRAYINYDHLVNGEQLIRLENGRLMLNDRSIIGSCQSSARQGYLVNSRKSTFLLSEVLNKIKIEESKFLVTYTYNMPNSIDLKGLITMDSMTIARNGSQYSFMVDGIQVPLALKNRGRSFSKRIYKVLDATVSSSGKSVEFILK